MCLTHGQPATPFFCNGTLPLDGYMYYLFQSQTHAKSLLFCVGTWWRRQGGQHGVGDSISLRSHSIVQFEHSIPSFHSFTGR